MSSNESQLHKALVYELAAKLEMHSFQLKAVDGITQNNPEVVQNRNRVGDLENKMPDIDAINNNQIIRGEAKIGNGDIEALHSITQYHLFSGLHNNGIPSLLYVIVPASKKQLLNDVIVRNIPEAQWKNILLVSSERFN